MKSGTTWLERLMDKHPRISVSGEFHWEFMDRGLEKMANTRHGLLTYFQHLDDLRDGYEALVRRHILAVEKVRKAETKDFDQVVWLGDRTPEQVLPFTLRKAHYIIIMRDGRDTLVSAAYHMLNQQSKRPFLDNPELLALHAKFVENPHYFDENPEELLSCESFVRGFSWNWAQAVESNFEQFQKAQRDEIPENIHLLKYESLLDDFQASKDVLFRFLDVDPAECLPLDDLTTPGFPKARPTAFERRGAAGEWPKYFNDESVRWFGEEAYQALVKVGYEW